MPLPPGQSPGPHRVPSSAPPTGKCLVSPLHRAPQNGGPQGPETPRSATACNCTSYKSFNIKRLSILQKKEIRIITCSKYNSHTEPILKSLNILRIYDIFTRQCLTFYHNVINNSVPMFCKILFSQHSIHHGYNIRPNNLVAVPFSRTSRLRKNIRYHIPTLLNSFPHGITDKLNTHNLHGFCSYLTKYLLGRYQDTSCTVPNSYVCRQT